MTLDNDYIEAIEGLGGLFAVKLSDGGWSIADGPGKSLSQPEEIALAGWHLPVRFEAKDVTLQAIRSGPDGLFNFDIDPEGIWVKHALAQGAQACPAYAWPWPRPELKTPSTLDELALEMAEAIWQRVEPPVWWDAIQDYIVADGAIGNLRGHMVAAHVEGIRVVRGAIVVGQVDWPDARYSDAPSHLSK